MFPKPKKDILSINKMYLGAFGNLKQQIKSYSQHLQHYAFIPWKHLYSTQANFGTWIPWKCRTDFKVLITIFSSYFNLNIPNPWMWVLFFQSPMSSR